ncbi:hypothetical protein [Microbacterium sp. TWP3-1-2b2]|uniref:hypothetical protein n=1 Tax=Microbacterium sp. TWP3-1-2b2 TaxID=2804651 RepID=UPI003CE8C49F
MLALLALTASALSACTPTPEPTPTPTAAFASEAEAFAAAEEVYRAYNDAGNARRNGQSDPNPQDFLIGTALEGDIDALNRLETAGLHLVGHVEVASFTPVSAKLEHGDVQVEAVVCLDATETQVIDEDGTDVTPSNRVPVVAQAISFIGVDSELLISMEDSAKEEPCDRG